MDERINYLIDSEDNGVQLRTPDNGPIWLNDDTRWDGILPQIIIKPRKSKTKKNPLINKTYANIMRDHMLCNYFKLI